MLILHRIAIVVLLGLAVSASCAAPSEQCPKTDGLSLQILGSGGPIADDGRASSAYLIWIDGKSRILIDAGGGAFLRFGEAQASFADLDFIGISHFHTDHSADLPALLKSGYFSDRSRSLTVAGPDTGGPFPGLQMFLQRLLDPDDGAYGYLSGYLDGSGGLPRIQGLEVSSEDRQVVSVFSDSSRQLQIDAMHVPHGIVPALAYRVSVGEAVIVFSGDQNGDDPRFVDFAGNANVLLMHMPVPQGIGGAGRRLHAPPEIIGSIAEAAKADKLVLSHFMARSLRNFDENVNAVRAGYRGDTVIANDLACVQLDD